MLPTRQTPLKTPMQISITHDDGRRLTVTTDEKVSWQDDEYHIREWTLDLIDPKTAEMLFHDSGYGPPPYDEHSEDSIRSWLACTGEVGTKRAQDALKMKRMLLEKEQLTALEKSKNSKAKILELINLAHSAGSKVLVEFDNEAPFNFDSTLSSIIRHTQNLRDTKYTLTRLVKEVASIDAQLAALA